MNNILHRLSIIKNATQTPILVFVFMLALACLATFPVVLNVANDEVVAAFLNNFIQFSDIPNLIENALNQHEFIDSPDLKTISEISQWTVNYIHDEISAVA